MHVLMYFGFIAYFICHSHSPVAGRFSTPNGQVVVLPAMQAVALV